MLDFLIYNPLTNIMLLIYDVLFKNYALAIIVLTALIRLLTMPLTSRQQEASIKMQALQPKIKELQEKYKSEPKKLQEETRKLGFNPLGGCLPLIIQFPVLIGLYTAIQRSLAFNPLSLLELGKHLYAFPPFNHLSSLMPIDSMLLGVLDMATVPNYLSISVIIPLLVVGTTWLSNKMMMTPATDAQSQQMNQTMGLMMPLMIGFFSLQTPIGLGLYWIVSNMIGVGQYYLMKPRMDALKKHYGVGGAGAVTISPSDPASPDKPLFSPPKSKVRAKSNPKRDNTQKPSNGR